VEEECRVALGQQDYLVIRTSGLTSDLQENGRELRILEEYVQYLAGTKNLGESDFGEDGV